MKPWYGYVVWCADESLYCGITTDVERRVHEHNQTKKGAKYCKSRRPVELVAAREFPDRSSALKWENFFKKLDRNSKEIVTAFHMDWYRGYITPVDRPVL